MVSKFSYKSFLFICIIPGIIFGFWGYVTFLFDKTEPSPPLNGIPLMALLTFTLIWLFFGEFRTKMIKVKLQDDSFIVKKFGGLSSSKKYFYSEMDGFKISILHSLAADNEYLYLMQQEKKVCKISDFYHKNYYEMKEELQTKLKYLSLQKFSYIEDLKEIFT